MVGCVCLGSLFHRRLRSSRFPALGPTSSSTPFPPAVSTRPQATTASQSEPAAVSGAEELQGLAAAGGRAGILFGVGAEPSWNRSEAAPGLRVWF